ncbi:hypothetical protein IQ238_03725 [Pleurocapsales cyanobacterium LEGE 06147]|nr:hypothetical protein [Pleurocapsales cyanobacterium LEGE 06147]
MSIITKIIVNADAEVRYLTPGELEQIRYLCQEQRSPSRTGESFNRERDYIVKQAANQLFQSRPHLVSSGSSVETRDRQAIRAD